MAVLASADLSQRLSRTRFIVIGALVMLGGLGARYASHRYMPKGEVSHIVSEIGMAMIVAAVVTLLYEVNARAEFTGHTMSHVLRTVIGDMFDTELWEELRRQLLEQRAIRREFSVRIRLTRVADLIEPRAVLQMTTSYRAYALHPSQTIIRMLHYLDDFMRDEPQERLARLTSIRVISTPQSI